jgi:2'-5' RNA ligase
MKRLFVALELPDAVRRHLALLQAGVPGARWVEPENLHLTLRFIGEVEDGVLHDIDEALDAVSAQSFDLTLEGSGQFGTGTRARTLWAGVARSEGLIHLQQKVESALVRIGLPAEERKYTPHVSLARLHNASPDRLARFLAENGLFRAGPIRVNHFTLFLSHFGRGGAVYEPLQDYALT